MWSRPPIICVVTRVRGAGRTAERTRLLSRLGTAASAGVSMIQVRERQLDDRQLAGFVRDVKGVAQPQGTLVLVNDRIDIARAAGADGVHLKSDGPAETAVRSILSPAALVGRSVHSVAEAEAASGAGCDYVLFGTVFPSISKPASHAVAGVAALAAVCRAVPIPVIAIGGITVERAAEVRSAGAAGVAAISLFADTRDLEQTVRQLQSALTLPPGRV